MLIMVREVVVLDELVCCGRCLLFKFAHFKRFLKLLF